MSQEIYLNDFSLNQNLSVVGNIHTTGQIISGGQEVLGLILPTLNQVFTTVQSNSSTTWNYQGTDLKALSANWQSTYTTVTSNSAKWESVYSSTAITSSNWDSAYSTVQTNSATTWNYQGTDLKNLSANWQTGYEYATAYSAVSSTFLTSETDSQTLSFNEGTKDLSISNGNTVSLSALIDETAIDTGVRALTGDYSSVYNTVQSNSATNWNYQGTDLKDLSANWQEAYTNVVNNSAAYLSAADLSFLSVSANWDSVYSSVAASSASWEESAEILPTVTDYLSTNNVLVSSITVTETLNVSQGIEVGPLLGNTIFYVSLTGVGVNTETPNEALTVSGNISSSGTIYDADGNSGQWNSTYSTVAASSASWEESAEILPTVTNYLSTNNVLVSSVMVTNTLSVVSGIEVGDPTSTAVFYVSMARAGINTETPNEALTVFGNISSNNIVYAANSNSGQWKSAYSSVANTSANWDSAYTSFNANSATYVKTVATTTPGTSAVTNIIAVSALPVSPDPNTLYIVI
jgi:gas vesicle protein